MVLELISFLKTKQHTSVDDTTISNAPKRDVTNINFPQLDILMDLCILFPQSLENELLIGDCCWAFASSWYRDGLNRVHKLEVCILTN